MLRNVTDGLIILAHDISPIEAASVPRAHTAASQLTTWNIHLFMWNALGPVSSLWWLKVRVLGLVCLCWVLVVFTVAHPSVRHYLLLLVPRASQALWLYSELQVACWSWFFLPYFCIWFVADMNWLINQCFKLNWSERSSFSSHWSDNKLERAEMLTSVFPVLKKTH